MGCKGTPVFSRLRSSGLILGGCGDGWVGGGGGIFKNVWYNTQMSNTPITFYFSPVRYFTIRYMFKKMKS